MVGENEGSTGTAEAAATSTEGAATEVSATPPAEESAEGVVTETTTPPAYTPNLKYNVLKEEKEFPTWAKDLVKTADVEKQFRDIFSKTDGFETLKQHRDTLVQENTQMREQWEPFVKDAQSALESAKKGDLDSFFEKVGIPEVDILKYALYRLQLREKPEALAAHESTRRMQQQLDDLTRQNQAYAQSFTTNSVQLRETDLNTQLARPEILATVQAFDARMGKSGAFRAEVIQRGKLHASMGKDVSAEQATQEVLQLIGFGGQKTAEVGQPGQGTGGETSEPKPVLPNIRGKGTSPAKRVPRSTEELRKLARELNPVLSSAR